MLEGRIVADSLEFSFINILNKNSYKGTTNDREGNFSIAVKENDTLRFSSVQFKNKEIVIGSSIMLDRFLEVFLEPNVNQLDEVFLSNSKLIGALGKDFTKIQFFDKYQLNAPQLREDVSPLIDRKLAATGGDPTNLLLNTITGERKRIKQIKKNLEYDQRIEKALLMVGRQNIIDMGIVEDKLMLFLYYCADDKRFDLYVNGNNRGLLMDFFMHKTGIWKERIE